MALCITHERLLEVLGYDQETGVFTWKKQLARRCPAGKKAGCLDPEGYVLIRIEGVNYRANRLAWFYVTGEWPENLIDHRDCDRANNRFSNLREATFSQNQHNSRIPKSNTSGLKGASWHSASGKWQSHIRVSGKSLNLGYFLTKEEAHQAYSEAATNHHGEFARTG